MQYSALLPVGAAAAPKSSEAGGRAEEKPDSAKQIVLGLVFDMSFGFLLRKGGVAKYEVLLHQGGHRQLGAQESLYASAEAVTDGLWCLQSVTATGATH